jgi:hypothetical protein
MLTGCGGDGLPVNFNSLTLDKKVVVYGSYLEDHVNPQDSARLSIASHGGEAAGQMAEYLAGERAGFPSLEAIIIVRLIQEKVCSLQGSPVPLALEKFLERDSDSQAEHAWARVTLDEIESGSILPPCVMRPR